MARRRSPRVSTGSGSDIVVVNTPAPVTRRASSGGRRRSRGRRGGRRRSYARGGQGSYKTRMTSMAVGGLAYGLLEKHFPNLPTIPILGKSGTVAVAAYVMNPKQQILRDMGLAAATIAGYSFGSTGSVSGVDVMGHGLATRG